MPIYEFHCENCGHREEKILKISEEKPKECPKCGKVWTLLITNSSFALTGTGWARDNYS